MINKLYTTEDYIKDMKTNIDKKNELLVSCNVRTKLPDLARIINEELDKVSSFVSYMISENKDNKATLYKLDTQTQSILFLIYIVSKELNLNNELLENNYWKYKKFLEALDKKRDKEFTLNRFF